MGRKLNDNVHVHLADGTTVKLDKGTDEDKIPQEQKGSLGDHVWVKDETKSEDETSESSTQEVSTETQPVIAETEEPAKGSKAKGK